MKKLVIFVLCTLLVIVAGAEPTKEKLLTVAASQVGVREATGANDGEQVEAYLAAVNLGKGYAWCAAFVTWVFRKADYKVPPLPMAAQWLTPKKRISKDVLIPSDVFGVYFGTTVRHVGFIERSTSTKIYTIEGNTNDNGSREGIGVFRRIRLKKTNLVYSRWT